MLFRTQKQCNHVCVLSLHRHRNHTHHQLISLSYTHSCYVRLSDYMICDALHTVLLGSVQEMLHAVRPREVVEPAE